jgi:hypothetical protein
MNRTTSRGTLAGCSRTVLFLILVFVCCLSPEWLFALAEQPQPSPASGNATVFLFNLNPSRSYSILKNSAPFSTTNSSQAGAVVYTDAVKAGDQYEIAESGVGPQPPTAPTGVSANGDDAGCAQVQWDANPELDVDFYRVYYGPVPSTYNESVDVTGSTGAAICGLASGDYYFAVRAHNTAGLLSDLSQEVSASVSNGSTQPPLPPLIVDASEGSATCFEVSWTPNGSPDVVGYIVDYGTQSVEGGQATSYEHAVEVGNTTSYSRCGLADGTYYVSVRSKNFAGMLSAYAQEDTVEVVPTAVFITAFSAAAVAGGVELAWEIWTDEALRGCKLYRSRQDDAGAIVLNGGLPLDPSRSSWVDQDVEPVTTYLYTLVVIGEDGAEHRSTTEQVTTPAWSLSLDQNVPNPFNPSTSISFVVPEPSRASLVVYDVTGAQVRRLVDEAIPAGRRTVHWDGTNDDGVAVGSGTYFYRLTVGNRTATRKMLLIK